MNLNAIDLFSGCGGSTIGLKKAGFDMKVAIENEKDAVATYMLNHAKTCIIHKDIRTVSICEIKRALGSNVVHLLSGCPPCQGFSRLRKLNKRKSVTDDRNKLILEYLRLVKGLKPYTIMMENVPGLIHYHVFKSVVKELKILGYYIKIEIVNLKDYGVPQSRKRLIMVGSRLGDISIIKGDFKKYTVRDAIGKLESTASSKDRIHRIVYSPRSESLKLFRLIPSDGGNRCDLPKNYSLKCHKNPKVGFSDVYGRLKWDDISPTITSGCLNPSKGRFLHPTEHRSISAREASLLQSFPKNYKFPKNITKGSISTLIGNALPPRFSYLQSKNIIIHLKAYLE